MLLEAGAPAGVRDRFIRRARALAERPASLAVVTSSIRYEAEIVLGEVLRVIREEVAAWPVPGTLREKVAALFESTDSLYDARITASDSSEIRLKPHPDLYAIALHRLGVGPEEYPLVLGLEDSTAGVVAIKSAGCGLCVAVPFEGTAHHDFSVADHVVTDGLAELMLRHDLFVS